MVPSLAALVGVIGLAAVGTALIAVRRRAREMAEEPPRLPCRGGGGGTLHISQRVSAYFALQMEGDESGVRGRLAGAVVARGELGWAARAAQRPPIPQGPRTGSGGTLGGIWAVVDVCARVAWIGAERVPLPDGHNVVLLDRADGVGGPPVVIRTLAVKPEFALPGADCGIRNARGARARNDAIIAALLRSPEVRTFVEG